MWGKSNATYIQNTKLSQCPWSLTNFQDWVLSLKPILLIFFWACTNTCQSKHDIWQKELLKKLLYPPLWIQSFWSSMWCQILKKYHHTSQNNSGNWSSLFISWSEQEASCALDLDDDLVDPPCDESLIFFLRDSFWAPQESFVGDSAPLLDFLCRLPCLDDGLDESWLRFDGFGNSGTSRLFDSWSPPEYRKRHVLYNVECCFTFIGVTWVGKLVQSFSLYILESPVLKCEKISLALTNMT